MPLPDLLVDCLYTGPPLAENIFDILLRFRASRIALTGDVERVFLMVSIAEEDRDLKRTTLNAWFH